MYFAYTHTACRVVSGIKMPIHTADADCSLLASCLINA